MNAAAAPPPVPGAGRIARLRDVLAGGYLALEADRRLAATVRGFHPTADDALNRWIDTRKALGLRNGPLFCTLDGAPLYPQYVRLLLGRLAGKAGIDKRVHPHGLRHTFADELRAAEMDVVTISKIARALIDRGHVPLPGPPDQRPSCRRARGRRPATAQRVTDVAHSHPDGGVRPHAAGLVRAAVR